MLELQRDGDKMISFYDTLKESPLFRGIGLNDFKILIICLPGKTLKCKKNDIILAAGEEVNVVGLVLSGWVKVVKEDVDGNENILAELPAPSLFYDVFAYAELDYSPYTVFASSDCEVLLLNAKKLTETCPQLCPAHISLNRNLLRAVARKGLLFNEKVEILSKRTIRERLLCYFGMQNSNKFTIPYNREELAHYLCVDRSAMSNELSKMQKEGLLAFSKNSFEIFT
jgi:CRP-like cAMP-binding protein